MHECLIDSGNTRLKWAWRMRGDSTESSLHQIHTERHGEDALRALRADLQQHPNARLFVSNVAGEGFATSLQRLAIELGLTPPHFLQADAHCNGLTSGYSTPAQLGIDRWLAMLAAHQQYPQGFLLVDLGSAITLDRVDARGQHQGGLIAPGFDAMLAGLQQATALRCDGLQTARTISLAHTTADAIATGCASALVGLIKTCVQQDEPLIITGGDAHWLLPLLHTNGLPQAVQALHLVLKGLALRTNTP